MSFVKAPVWRKTEAMPETTPRFLCCSCRLRERGDLLLRVNGRGGANRGRFRCLARGPSDRRARQGAARDARNPPRKQPDGSVTFGLNATHRWCSELRIGAAVEVFERIADS